MSIGKSLMKALGKEAKSLARQQVRSVVAKKASALIGNLFKKSDEKLAEEAESILGYPTQHFVGKDNEVVFKPSAIFFQEWLMASPLVKDRLFRDEETGKVFLDNKELTDAKKAETMKLFLSSTKIKNCPVGHIDQALKLLPASDRTSKLLQERFSAHSGATPVLDSWLQNCFGESLKTDHQLANRLFKKWIVGTAARALTPGESLDGCLTLKGPPGWGKTRFFRELLPPPFDQRTGEIYCNVRSPQKFVESIVGKTIACFDELSILEDNRVEETFKQLLSSQYVDVRLPYRRDPQRYNLRQGFSATTNQERFIKDPALSRRMWCLSIEGGGLNFAYLRANREQLWKEAISLVGKENVWLDGEEQNQVEESNRKFLL